MIKRITIYLLFFIPFLSCAQFGNKHSLIHPTIGASSVINADLDNDDDDDILTSSFNSSEITLFENIGLSSFDLESIHVISQETIGAISVTVSDLDDDGDLDIISASSGDNKIALYENLGNLIFGPQMVISNTITSLKLVDVADLDNDGNSDIIVLSENNVSWFRNNTNLTFDTQIILTPLTELYRTFHTCDYDNDNDLDLLYVGYNCLYKMTNTGNGIFSPPSQISNLAYGIVSIDSGDIDNDGDLDLVTINNENIREFMNNGLGVFSAPITIRDVFNGLQIEIKDMDDDTDLDIIWSENSPYNSNDYQIIYWTRNDGFGSYEDNFIVTYAMRGYPRFSISDIDNDGDLDISSSSKVDHKVGYSLNIADTTFENRVIISSSAMGPSSAITGDLNIDGFEDIIVGSEDGKISYFKNNGDGVFDIQLVINGIMETGAPTIKTGDLDNDGDLDIISFSAYHSYGTGNNVTKLYWLENHGDNTFLVHNINEPGFSNGIESGRVDIAISDLDNDGYLDIVVSQYDANRVNVRRNLGNGTFTNGNLLISPFSLHPTSIGISDMDNDGLKDILIGSANISFYKNLGNFIFDSEQLIIGVSAAITSIDIHDVDYDGDKDIIIGNSTDYSVSWFENYGNLAFSQENTLATYPNSAINSVVATDIDQDGMKDILFSVLLPEPGVTGWIRNDGNGVFSSPQLIDSTNAGANSATSADLDNDGDLEVIDVSLYGNNIYWYENQILDQSNTEGRVFADFNQNGLFDSTDIGIKDALVFASPESDFSYSFSNGNFIIQLSDTIGAYSIQASSIAHWGLTTDSSVYHVSIDSNLLAFENLDFGFAPIESVNEIKPSIIEGFPRCSTIGSYWINIKNTGTTLPSGVIDFELDPQINFISASILPDSIIGQHIYWHYDSLLYFSTNQINLQVQFPDFNASGDSLNSYLSATVIDEISGNVLASFSDTLYQILVCAYDPNDKTVNPVGVDAPGYISIDQEWLEYTIRFQNTGNDTALRVVIKDQLDENLDWLTLEPIAYSHAVRISGNQNGLMTFTFDGIHLPDSNVNELLSHGFIRYRIKLKDNLNSGTQIKNTANIYFDFNEEIITNTVLNTLYECPSILEIQMSSNSICMGDEFNCQIQGELSNSTIEWQLLNIEITNPDFNWVSDSIGLFNLQAIVSNEFCIDRDSIIQLVVNSIPVIFISSVITDTLCTQNSAISLPTATPTGGIYSGNGVTGTQFDPTIAGVGIHLIYYTFTDISNCSADDSVYIVVEDCLGLNELHENNITLYPNPFTQSTTIQFNQELVGTYDLTLYDVMGKLVYSKTGLTGKTQLIERNGMASGVYQLAIIDHESGIQLIKRLVIE